VIDPPGSGPEARPTPGARPASISFDRAATFYDETRSLPHATMSALLAAVVPELLDRQPCLEIGVGTGRLALPLARAGIRLVGLDLSHAMLARLTQKAERDRSIALVRGDATLEPFREGSFGSALAVHVLHLITDWRTAAAELVRVVRAGGTIVVDVGGPGATWWADLQDAFCRAAGIDPARLGRPTVTDVDEAMSELGAVPRELAEVVSVEESTIEERVDQLASGVFSFTWQVDDETRRRAGDQAREWARANLGSLTERRRLPRRTEWRAYDR
jgi:ubiquinone/menaquinone biosynthesis C-methylase UbiE